MIPWGEVGVGLVCCLSTAALYLKGRNYGRDTDALKSVTRVDHLKDLAILLDTEREVMPLVVAITGKVGSELPIKCEHSGLRVVIVVETAEQHFLKRSDGWKRDSEAMLSMSKEVPWYLDDGTGRVYVLGAQRASSMVLTVANEVFEESGRSVVCESLHSVKGLKMLGVQRTKKVLPTGTYLTVVGEAIKDDIGTIWIQKPHKGPFYVTRKNIDHLIAILGEWARWYKYASMVLAFMVLTAYGIYLLVMHTVSIPWKEIAA